MNFISFKKLEQHNALSGSQKEEGKVGNSKNGFIPVRVFLSYHHSQEPSEGYIKKNILS